MTSPGDWAKDVALWQRWRQHAQPEPRFDAGEPMAAEPMALAAYAEGRLDETQAEPIEDWLVSDPDALADLVAARAAASSPLPQAAEQMIARAAALISPGSPNVVPFWPRPARRPQWRMAMAWGGLAASLIATSTVGFALGDNAYLNLVGAPAAAESTIHELLDPPSALFLEDEEPTT